MKTKKQTPDFLYIGRKLLHWYKFHGRDLPFRKTRDPYKIWICEIIFQQTRIQQGLGHYNRFIERFPDARTLAEADGEEVLLFWKGLGYYSRALNLHKASKQIMNDFGGQFPDRYDDILTLQGVGRYTAAAVASICFNEARPAVDGNFYRVLSRLFADGFNISNSGSFAYFTQLALKVMPEKEAGSFNQAVMDLGSEVCKPKGPDCGNCPLQDDCAAYQTGRISEFPVKSKKAAAAELQLHYYFIECKDKFLIKQRGDDFIWKKLYEFPTEIPQEFERYIVGSKTIRHKLTHKNLTIQIDHVHLNSKREMNHLIKKCSYKMVNFEESYHKTFPKPLENYLKSHFSSHENPGT